MPRTERNQSGEPAYIRKDFSNPGYVVIDTNVESVLQQIANRPNKVGDDGELSESPQDQLQEVLERIDFSNLDLVEASPKLKLLVAAIEEYKRYEREYKKYEKLLLIAVLSAIASLNQFIHGVENYEQLTTMFTMATCVISIFTLVVWNPRYQIIQIQRSSGQIILKDSDSLSTHPVEEIEEVRLQLIAAVRELGIEYGEMDNHLKKFSNQVYRKTQQSRKDRQVVEKKEVSKKKAYEKKAEQERKIEQARRRLSGDFERSTPTRLAIEELFADEDRQ